MSAQVSNPAVPRMASPYQPLERPIVVIGPQYLAQYPVDLSIATKLMSIGECNFGVKDTNGTLIFKVKTNLWSIRDRRHLLDSLDNRIVTLQEKILTAHRRWQVYRGDSTNNKDLLFSVRKSSIIQMLKTELDVFLAANTSENAPDFRIKGSFMERSCATYLGTSDTIVAQMHKKHTVSTIVLDTDNFGVTVYPNIDYAFIVTLMVILNDINKDRNGDD